MLDSQILQVVGFSQTGKTSFISKLIEKLAEKNLRILTLKSARQHDYVFSKKDSDIFSQKGSSVSIVAFKSLTQVSIREDENVFKTVGILVDSFKIDIIIIEGFKEENYSKIIIWDDEIAKVSDSFNFEGMKYLLCSKEDLLNYKEYINKINNHYNFYVAEESEDLIDKIIRDYKF